MVNSKQAARRAQFITYFILALSFLVSESAVAFLTAGKAKATGDLILLYLRAEDISATLPPGFELIPDPSAPPGKHPLVLNQSYLTDGKWRYGLILVPGLIDYNEVIMYVPSVTYDGGPRRVLLSSIFLDNSTLMQIGVDYFSMRKQLAVFQSSPNQFAHLKIIRDSTDILQLKRSSTKRVSPQEQRQFSQRIRDLITAPGISENNGEVTCFEFSWDNLIIGDRILGSLKFDTKSWLPLTRSTSDRQLEIALSESSVEAVVFRGEFDYRLSYPRSCD